jgi:hypothetical protein
MRAALRVFAMYNCFVEKLHPNTTAADSRAMVWVIAGGDRRTRL